MSNFIRAETNFYFGTTVKTRGFGKFDHDRQMVAIDKQSVVRMNRDTIYSSGVFDLEAGPVTITLPDPGRRFMSMQVVSEDHHTTEVVYAPGRYTSTKERVGTRYVQPIIRTLADPQSPQADPESPQDMMDANGLQDAIRVEQASIGKFEVPNCDSVSQKKIRDALGVLGSALGDGPRAIFGSKNGVDPLKHLIGTAIAGAVIQTKPPSTRARIPRVTTGRPCTS